MQDYKIEITYSEHCLYSIRVNKRTILECLGLEEVKECTIAELIKFYEEDVKEFGDEEM